MGAAGSETKERDDRRGASWRCRRPIERVALYLFRNNSAHSSPYLRTVQIKRFVSRKSRTCTACMHVSLAAITSKQSPPTGREHRSHAVRRQWGEVHNDWDSETRPFMWRAPKRRLRPRQRSQTRCKDARRGRSDPRGRSSMGAISNPNSGCFRAPPPVAYGKLACAANLLLSFFFGIELLRVGDEPVRAADLGRRKGFLALGNRQLSARPCSAVHA